FSICLGMLANMSALFVLGMVGRLHLPGVAAVLAAMLAASVAALLRRRQRLAGVHWPRSRPRLKSAWVLQAATLVALFLLTIAVSLHPPGHWHDSMYQLPLARHYAQQAAITLHDAVRFPLFPQNVNLLFSLGIMLGDALSNATSASVAGSPTSALWHFGL